LRELTIRLPTWHEIFRYPFFVFSASLADVAISSLDDDAETIGEVCFVVKLIFVTVGVDTVEPWAI